MRPLQDDTTAADLVPGLAIALVLLSLCVLLALLVVHRLRSRSAHGLFAGTHAAHEDEADDGDDGDDAGDGDDADGTTGPPPSR